MTPPILRDLNGVLAAQIDAFADALHARDIARDCATALEQDNARLRDCLTVAASVVESMRLRCKCCWSTSDPWDTWTSAEWVVCEACQLRAVLTDAVDGGMP
jgi:hypothetical protein